jgi:hypothetical protein
MSLTLCVIVRDEEERLAAALTSAHGGYDDLVVVDTGSRDGSREVARRFGGQVIVFKAANDANGTLLNFAAARNVALSAARGRYWWWMDADEVALSGTVDRLREIARGGITHAVRGVTREGGTRWLRTRLAPRDGRHVWAGPVHEWITTPNGWVDDARIVFDHRPRDRGRAPLVRNLRILGREVAAGRASSRELFYVARTLEGLGERESAVRAYHYFLAGPSRFEADVAFARLYLARLLFRLGELRAAAQQGTIVICAQPRFAEAACLLAEIAEHLGDLPLAAQWYTRAIASAPCPFGPLFHEPACYGEYPRRRLYAIAQVNNQRRNSYAKEGPERNRALFLPFEAALGHLRDTAGRVPRHGLCRCRSR